MLRYAPDGAREITRKNATFRKPLGAVFREVGGIFRMRAVFFRTVGGVFGKPGVVFGVRGPVLWKRGVFFRMRSLCWRPRGARRLLPHRRASGCAVDPGPSAVAAHATPT